MTKKDASKPIDRPDVQGASADEGDTEGHLLIGINALGKPTDREARARANRSADANLPPLSKPWPSMRDEKKS